MKVKFNKKNFFIVSTKRDANPVVLIEETPDKNFKITIEAGLNIPNCKKYGITKFYYNIFNGRLVQNASNLEINMLDGLNSSIVDSRNKKSLIVRERSEKLLYSPPSDRLIYAIESTLAPLMPGVSYKQDGDGSKFEYFEVYSGDLLDENVLEMDKKISNLKEMGMLKSFDFCLDNLRKGTDPALYRGLFPVKGIEKGAEYEKKSNGIGEWIFTNEPVKYRKKIITTDFFPCNISFMLSKDKISSLAGELTIEIISKTEEQKILSVERFIIGSDIISESILPTESTQLNIYYRKINRNIRDFDSTYNTVSNVSSIAAAESSAFYSRYQNSLIRYINGTEHTKSKCNFEKNINIAQSINLFSVNEVPFSVLKINESRKTSESNGSATNDVRILFENIPEGIRALGIERRDATLRQKFLKINLPTFVSPGSNQSFYDYGLKNGHVYEYRPYYINDMGHTKVANNPKLYLCKQARNDVVLTLSNMLREIVEENVEGGIIRYPQASFTINAELQKSGYESVKNFLETNGYSIGNLGVSENNYDVYKELFIFEVSRQNIRTGEIEKIGFSIRNGKFYDKTAAPQSTSTAKPLNAFDNYRYFVRAGLKSAAALVPTQEGTNNFGGGVRRDVNYNSYKLKQKNLYGDYVIPNTKNMSTVRGIEENFLSNYIGIESALDSYVDRNYPRVSSLEIDSNLYGFNKLTWTITGDQDYIDHFRIYAEADGIFCFIAAVHPHASTTNSYSYKDSTMYNRLGKVKYTVTPVLLSFKESQGNKSSTIVRNNNLPTFLR